MDLSPGNPQDLVDRATTLHKEAFGSDPTAVAHAPATWTMLGEYTDAFGGVVLVGLSDLRTVAAVSPREDDTMIVHTETFNPARGTFDTARYECTMAQVAALVQQDGGRAQGPVGVAEHCGGVVSTMMHRQMLSRDTAGFNVVLCSTIPEESGIGGDVAADVALALAVGQGIEDLSSAPVRAKLADVCYQASAHYAAHPSVRARYTAALRGHGGELNIVDYLDGSITQAPHPVGKMTDTAAFVVLTDQSVDCSELIVERHDFVEQAAHAFGTALLRQLPDAPTRVIDWLSAIHKVNGPEGVPSVNTAGAWLAFLADETAAANKAAQAIRSRRHHDLFPIVNESQDGLDSGFGLVGDVDRALAQLCRARGALSARSAEAGASSAVIAIVGRERAANFVADLTEDGLTVVELVAGTPAR